MSETALMRIIQVEVSKLGHRIFRNQAGTYKLEDGRYISSGLCDGASDLIGWTKRGRFLAIEVKTPGSKTHPKRLESQFAFLRSINQAGGIGIMADSVQIVLDRLAAAE